MGDARLGGRPPGSRRVQDPPHLPGPSSTMQGARCPRWPSDVPGRSPGLAEGPKRRRDVRGALGNHLSSAAAAKWPALARWPRSGHRSPLLHSLVRAKGAFGGFRASAGVLAAGPAHPELYSYFPPCASEPGSLSYAASSTVRAPPRRRESPLRSGVGFSPPTQPRFPPICRHLGSFDAPERPPFVLSFKTYRNRPAPWS
jgi:hypothetical protein